MDRATTFAVVGDVHGKMKQMVSLVERATATAKVDIDFVLQVGDFEPTRHLDDLKTMAAPSKYRQLGDWPAFAAGTEKLPWPVYFIGGNHEPYGYLDRDIAGFELCENCRYLGRAFSGKIHDVRVAGLSGIYSQASFYTPLPSLDAFDRVSNKEYIYFRDAHVDHLLQRGEVDILIVHEWPLGVIDKKDESEFEQQRRSMRFDCVGNEYAYMLLELLKPRLVIAGHMHRHYRSTVDMDGTTCQFAALGKVGMSDDAVAIFCHDSEGIRELMTQI